MSGVKVAHLTVVCAADSHADRPFSWTLTRQMGRRGRVWVETDRETPTYPPGQGNPRPKIVTLLDENNQPVGGVPSTAGRGYRRQFRFKCGRCGLSVSVRAEDIEPMMDRIADSRQFEIRPGLSQVALSDVAAMLTP